MARPKLDIDSNEVGKLAGYGLTNIEIADFLGCSEGTIRGRFYENLRKGRAEMKKRLRQKQLDVAFKGNVAMLIFLGKSYLGQSEKQEVSFNQESIEQQLKNVAEILTERDTA
jgi:hypothetical protein